MAFGELTRGALLVAAATSCGIVLGIDEPNSRACTGCGGGTGANVSKSGEGGSVVESMAGFAASAGEDLTAGAGVGSETGGQGNHGTGATHSGEGGEAGMLSTQGGFPHSGAGEGGAGGAATLCDRYCDTIQESCTGDYQQYVDWVQCDRVCSLLPEGADLDDHGNSVACRLEYAERSRFAAGVERGSYCRAAGPDSDGACGSSCDGYCTIMAQTCTVLTAPLYHFPDIPSCLDECDALPDGMVGYSTNDAAVSDGNHVQCRLFHVVSAAVHDVEEHCEHAMGFTLCEAVR